VLKASRAAWRYLIRCFSLTDTGERIAQAANERHQLALGLTGAFLLVVIAWRLASRRYSLPYPVWQRWRAELENSLTRTSAPQGTRGGSGERCLGPGRPGARQPQARAVRAGAAGDRAGQDSRPRGGAAGDFPCPQTRRDLVGNGDYFRSPLPAPPQGGGTGCGGGIQGKGGLRERRGFCARLRQTGPAVMMKARRARVLRLKRVCPGTLGSLSGGAQ
jgi:hypothetical protein